MSDKLRQCVKILLLIIVVSGKSGVVPNIPPGVPPMLGTHQYIMSQGGLPFFQQPVYSYEDLQLLQQRIPHVVKCPRFLVNAMPCPFYLCHCLV